ncbi:MAG: helix-turn-helix transcriptional regulator [Alphaproteobacteria bacterium]|nr:helix-turn-helix transcriptional regulator [Alphaproteobacteria bacterium]
MSGKQLKEAFGQRLRALRQEAGMTQGELGFLAGGIGAPEICRYERGARLPTLATVFDLARGLGVPVAALMVRPEQEVEALCAEVMAELDGQPAEVVRRVLGVVRVLVRRADGEDGP